MPVRLRSAVYRPVPVTFSLPSCRTNPGAVWTVATPVPSHSYGRRSAARRRILSVGRPAPQPEMGDRLVPGMWRPEMAAEQRDGLDRDVRSEERRVGKEWRSRWSPDHLKKKSKKREARGKDITALECCSDSRTAIAVR